MFGGKSERGEKEKNWGVKKELWSNSHFFAGFCGPKIVEVLLQISRTFRFKHRALLYVGELLLGTGYVPPQPW